MKCDSCGDKFLSCPGPQPKKCVVDRLEAENRGLRAALRDLLSCGEEPCRLVHHTSYDHHDIGCPCPVLERYRALLGEGE